VIRVSDQGPWGRARGPRGPWGLQHAGLDQTGLPYTQSHGTAPHPSLRRLVDRDWNGPVRVLGGAGTGKTVVAMLRAK